MISTQDMRTFADDCTRWAEQTVEPSKRELIRHVGRHWLELAAQLERRIENGDRLADLKHKLG